MTGAVHGDFDLSLVWSRRGGLACVVFCTLFASCLSLTLSLPRMYRATATLLVAQAGGVEGSGRLTVTGDLETGLYTITEEILSQTRLGALMDRFNLYPELRSPAGRAAAIERLRADIKVKLKGVESGSTRPTIAFSVSVRGRDPEIVSRVANALASFYVEENLKFRERARLARLRQELAQMQQVYSSQYPDVIRLKMEIETTERQFAGALRVGDGFLPGKLGTPQRWGEAVPGREQEPAELSRRAEFRVLDPAMPPWTAAPDRLRLVLLGVLAAVGATAAAVLLAERLDTSFYSCDELRAFTRVPVLAAIPQIVTTADAASPRRWFTAVAVAGGLVGVLVSYYVAHGNEQLVWMLSRFAS